METCTESVRPLIARVRALLVPSLGATAWPGGTYLQIRRAAEAVAEAALATADADAAAGARAAALALGLVEAEAAAALLAAAVPVETAAAVNPGLVGPAIAGGSPERGEATVEA